MTSKTVLHFKNKLVENVINSKKYRHSLLISQLIQ